VDLEFQPGTTTAYVTGYGADAVFRVRFNPDGTVAEVGLAGAEPFINLAPGGSVPAGLDPLGIAITSAPTQSAYVIHEHSRNVSGISLASQQVTSAIASTDPPTGADAARLQGRRLFVTGTGRWSFKGQAWNSCEACHPDGLTDNVTWFFPRGPRQTPSLDGAYDPRDPTTPRLFNWTAIFDEVSDFELNTRANSGGVGAVVHRAGAAAPAVSDRIVFDGTTAVPPQVATITPQDGLSGAAESVAFRSSTDTPRSVLEDWEQLTRYVASVRAPGAPARLVASEVSAGRGLFTRHHCDGCHGGPRWTLSRRFYTPGEAASHRTTGDLINRTFTIPMGFPAAVAPAPGRFRLAPFDPGNDQLSCALRRVGTYAIGRGVAPADVEILEVRANGFGTFGPMSVNAQGITGFNPPPLVGLAGSAPYLHAGQARTLEELFSDTFRAHHQAFSAGWVPTGSELQALVAFLLSIDDSTATVPVPTRIPGTTEFDPDLCEQFNR
jgi:mono/diheme cytochrome c family protein